MKNFFKRFWALALAICLSLTTIVLLVIVLAALIQAQNSQALIQKQTIESRVVTVSQRCSLTNLDLQSAQRKDPKGVPGYTKALAGCYKQLAKVNKQNAMTP